MPSHDALEVLVERITALVRQFGLDAKRNSLSNDRAMTKRIDELMAAVHHIQNLVDQRRQERASVPDTSDW